MGKTESRNGKSATLNSGDLCFRNFCFLLSPPLLGRLGTALGRLWDGSKKPESSMIARLGTAGRLGEGGVWVCMPHLLNLNPSVFVAFVTFCSIPFRSTRLSAPFRGIPRLSAHQKCFWRWTIASHDPQFSGAIRSFDFFGRANALSTFQFVLIR